MAARRVNLTPVAVAPACSWVRDARDLRAIAVTDMPRASCGWVKSLVLDRHDSQVDHLEIDAGENSYWS